MTFDKIKMTFVATTQCTVAVGRCSSQNSSNCLTSIEANIIMSSLSASRGAAGLIILRRFSTRKRSLPSSVPSLQEFVHKQKVLHQYRSFLKSIRLIEDTRERQNAFQEVHREFRNHASLKDPLATQMAVTEGERKLKQIQSMVGYSDSTVDDDDSWLNTQDPEDERGRVGTEWPWQR